MKKSNSYGHRQSISISTANRCISIWMKAKRHNPSRLRLWRPMTDSGWWRNISTRFYPITGTRWICNEEWRTGMTELKRVYSALWAWEFCRITVRKIPEKFGILAAHWAELSTCFKYPHSVRTLFYTTNSIENFNRQLRKVTKNKTVFPNDDSLLKMPCLAQVDITRKWTGRCRDWEEIHSQFEIYFADRLPQ